MMAPEKRNRLDVHQVEALARRFECDPGFITRLYEASEKFREICGDYATCQEILERFRRLNRVDDEQVQDYTEMRDQLELELRACLGKANRRFD